MFTSSYLLNFGKSDLLYRDLILDLLILVGHF